MFPDIAMLICLQLGQWQWLHSNIHCRQTGSKHSVNVISYQIQKPKYEKPITIIDLPTLFWLLGYSDKQWSKNIVIYSDFPLVIQPAPSSSHHLRNFHCRLRRLPALGKNAKRRQRASLLTLRRVQRMESVSRGSFEKKSGEYGVGTWEVSLFCCHFFFMLVYIGLWAKATASQMVPMLEKLWTSGVPCGGIPKMVDL